MNPSNKDFLNACFGTQYHYAHVTDFTHDPDNIPSGEHEHLKAWVGDYFKNYKFEDISNQYFTISLFSPDAHGKARRRKALYSSTPVIVLDDVREKLSIDEAEKLPKPSWILETSPGSEQWGYILNVPCTERSMVENLLDGLVANGLAPDGKDPGMKGVTRYVRLPGGMNNKKSKLVNGRAFKCQMLSWVPFNRVTIEELAEPFNIDLEAPRRESQVEGAAKVSDNPLLHIPDLLHIKEIRSDGRFDVTCPWVDEHTGGVDNGTAIFTNADGSIGFKCHHGSCESRHAGDLLDIIDGYRNGFKSQFNIWNLNHRINIQSQIPPPPSPVKTVTELDTVSPKPPSPLGDITSLVGLLNTIRLEPPSGQKAMQLAGQFLELVDGVPEIEKINWHKQLKDHMNWNVAEFKAILLDLRNEWYSKSKTELNFYSETVFVGELNQFYDCKKRIFYTPDAYQNMHSHLDNEARKEALQSGRGTKVHKIDYHPDKPPVWEEKGVKYANTWSNASEINGEKGDVTTWLNHFKVMGWEEYADHIIQWMAFTLQKPGVKINHMLLFGSREGAGKDFLLQPLIHALGENSKPIDGHELISNFNGYVLGVKHLHVNEAELGNRSEAKAVSAKLKPLCAAPPEYLRVRELYVKPMSIRNLINVTMTTNSQTPIQLDGHSRRIFALWSNFQPRDENDITTPFWNNYFHNAWEWMKLQGGMQAVIHYLRYEVDVSQFSPGSAPPVTQFLTDIKENGKHPIQQTLEHFIREQKGVFQCDLLTSNDIARHLRTDVMYMEDILCEQKFFTSSRVNQFMLQISSCKQVKANIDGSTKSVWVLRDHARYEEMFKGDIGDLYTIQTGNYKKLSPMTVVR